jgi:hypothetical protein
MRTIYIDMDGVLSNFEKTYEERFGISPKEVRDQKEKGLYTKYWHQFVDDDGFKNLDKFPGMDELLDYLHQTPKSIQKSILTSTGGFDRHTEVSLQKMQWCLKNNIEYPVVTVPGRRFKSGYANSQSFMIDDTVDVIHKFIQQGGNGHLHIEPKATIIAVQAFIQGKD